MRKEYAENPAIPAIAPQSYWIPQRPSIFSCFSFFDVCVFFLPSYNPLMPHTRMRGTLNHADGTIFPCWEREHYAASVACYDKERVRDMYTYTYMYICICAYVYAYLNSDTIYFSNRFAVVRNDPDCQSPVALKRRRREALSSWSFDRRRKGFLSYWAKNWG